MTQWVNKNWAKTGSVIGIAITLLLLLSDLKWTEAKFLFAMNLALLMFHQSEEYVFPGGFKAFYNQSILNKNPITVWPLNDLGIFLVNVVAGWTFYLLAALLHAKALWLGAGLLMVSMANGVLHTAVAIILKKYNPGLLTGFFLFIPFGLFAVFSIKDQLLPNVWFSAAFVLLFGSAMIPAGIYLSNKMMTDR